MRTHFRLACLTTAIVLAGGLAACAEPMTRTTVSSYPAPTYSSPAPVYSAPPPAYVEYGRVANIEVLRTETKPQSSPGGMIIGAIAGGLLGNTIGKGGGRDVATIGGAIAGGAVGNQVGRSSAQGSVSDAYRVSIQTDNGSFRSYDIDTASNLRIGDRVRIENGQIFRL
jgi:outer membrane lipoprotein SlyB